MARKDEASTSTSQVPINSSINMSNVEYKKLVEKLTFQIFNVHTSMTAFNEEIEKLSSSNSKLVSRNEHLELMIVNIEALKQEIEYLKNKIVCADHIEIDASSRVFVYNNFLLQYTQPLLWMWKLIYVSY